MTIQDAKAEPRKTFAEMFAAVWNARDELNLRNIRPDRWTAVLLLPLCIILGDLRFLDIDVSLGDFDSVTLTLLAYGLGWLFCMALPAERLRPALKIAAGVSAAAFAALLTVPAGYTLLAFNLLFHIANAVCEACAFFAFCFALNNAERFFNMVVISVYYAVIPYIRGMSGISPIYSRHGVRARSWRLWRSRCS
jgi:hypothetical protein